MEIHGSILKAMEKPLNMKTKGLKIYFVSKIACEGRQNLHNISGHTEFATVCGITVTASIWKELTKFC